MSDLKQLLLIEDSPKLMSVLCDVFASEYNLSLAETDRIGLEKARQTLFELIIIDLTATAYNALGTCFSLRSCGVTCPIMVLSSDTGVVTKIKLLDSGANDYMTKPFSVGELKARLRSLLRQVSVSHREIRQPLMFADVELDRQNLIVKREGRVISLRRKEFMLLECLMERAGSCVTRLTLLRSAWPEAEEVWTNALDVHIKHLRDKLDRPFNKPMIQTVYGVGYRLDTTRA